MVCITHIIQLLATDEKIRAINLSPNYLSWRQGDYCHLAKCLEKYLNYILSNDEKLNLGISISVSTLERIFKGKYLIAEPIDLRQQKTLDKLAIFIGYKNWLDFIQNHKPEPSSSIVAQNNTVAELKEVIQNAIQAEFDAYWQLPNLCPELLEPYFSADSSAKMRIINVLHNLHSKNWTIKNPLNPSTYELLDLQIKVISNTEAEATTKEYWYLRWFDIETQYTHYVYNETNEQVYKLIKIDNAWKIKINAYPPPQNLEDYKDFII